MKKLSKSIRSLGLAVLSGVSVSAAVPLTLPAASTTAYASTFTSLSAVQQAANSIINPFVASGDFSGTVLLEEHGTILFDQAFGSANSSQGIPNTTQTRFAISALTQPFTAMAILQLVQQGLIGLDDPITKYVSNYPQGSNPITIRELLTHTSGAPGAANQPAATPGTKFQYSVLNYLLLGEIIAKVSGESYQTYIQQHILTPLGMTNTGFISSMANVPNAAMGYHKNLVGTVTPVTYQSQNFLSSDGLYSTADDLLKWEQALYTSKLVNFRAIKQMFTPDPISVSTLKAFGYGFGWELTLNGQVALSEGNVSGYHAFMSRSMQNDATVIILSNREWAPLDAMAQKLQALVLDTQLVPSNLSSTVNGQKDIVVNGNLLSKPFSRVASSTTHMPIWYIGKALETLNIKQSWDGVHHVWSLTLPASMQPDFSGIGIGVGNTDIVVNGQLVKRINTYPWLDPATGYKSLTVYAPIYYFEEILNAAGVHNSWDGTHWYATLQ